MSSTLTAEEIGRRGQEIYDRQIRSLVEPHYVGKYAAIDIDTGEYEIGDVRLDTVDRLIDRLPNATVYAVLIGYPVAAAMGGALRPNRP